MPKIKKSKIIIPLVIIIASVVAGVLLNSGNESDGGRHSDIRTGRVVGYLPYYSVDYLDKIDFSGLTHLNIAFTNPDSDGELSNGISDADMKKIVSACHESGVKAIASFGGGSIESTNYNKLMRGNPSGIKRFNKTILEYCKKYDLDGVDIDFEFISSSPAWEYFEEWINDLRAVCKSNDLIITAAVASWYSDNMSDETLKKFDYLLVMAYDNDASSKNHSSYEYAESQLDYYNNKRGVKKDKLVLGVPFYGYTYSSSGKMQWNSAASYRYILSKDSGADKGDSSGAYTYNGPDTIRKKAELSKDYGGIMMWELSQDAYGKNSLAKVIKKVYS